METPNGFTFKRDMRGSTKGTVRASWHGGKATRAVRSAAWKGIKRVNQWVYDESQRQVPVDTGQLRDSATQVLNWRRLRASVVYGDNTLRYGNATPASVYVRRQHEDMTLNHPNGGNAKFLENPSKASADFAAEWIASAIEDAL